MTAKECLNHLGMPVMLSLPHYFSEPVRMMLTKVSFCADDERKYVQLEVKDKTGSLLYVKPENVSEVAT